MPYYNLRRLSDHDILRAVCRDDAAALATFGKTLDVVLSLTGSAAPDYMMGWREEPTAAWVKTDIPVHSTSPHPERDA